MRVTPELLTKGESATHQGKRYNTLPPLESPNLFEDVSTAINAIYGVGRAKAKPRCNCHSAGSIQLRSLHQFQPQTPS